MGDGRWGDGLALSEVEVEMGRLRGSLRCFYLLPFTLYPLPITPVTVVAPDAVALRAGE